MIYERKSQFRAQPSSDHVYVTHSIYQNISEMCGEGACEPGTQRPPQ